MNRKRIVFMGTPDFAVASLNALVEAGFNIVGVITAPDKPAGRGKKIQMSAVKKYALEKKMNILQPTNLKNDKFLQELQSLKADLQIVVAFRMLPEKVWAMAPLGTFNLHASLLPQYRGAAPINWAIINGEKETGVTTFFIEKEIDTGNILFAEKVEITENDNAGSLHDKLMNVGAKLIVKTTKSIFNNEINPISQATVLPKNIKLAPKIFKNDCRIDWNREASKLYNFIRGMSPYPAAFTQIKNLQSKKKLVLKLFEVQKMAIEDKEAGVWEKNEKNELIIYCKKGALKVLELQLEGKKRMKTNDFLRGFDIKQYRIINS